MAQHDGCALSADFCCVVHLQSFRNLGLSSKGFYFFTVSLKPKSFYTTVTSVDYNRLAALPGSAKTISGTSCCSLKHRLHKEIVPGSVVSPVLHIRYAQEQVFLHEFLTFHCSSLYYADDWEEARTFDLVYQLFVCPLEKDSDSFRLEQVKLADTRILQVSARDSSSCEFVASLYPCTFDFPYSSLVSGYVMVTPMIFRTVVLEEPPVSGSRRCFARKRERYDVRDSRAHLVESTFDHSVDDNMLVALSTVLHQQPVPVEQVISTFKQWYGTCMEHMRRFAAELHVEGSGYPFAPSGGSSVILFEINDLADAAWDRYRDFLRDCEVFSQTCMDTLRNKYDRTVLHRFLRNYIIKTDTSISASLMYQSCSSATNVERRPSPTCKSLDYFFDRRVLQDGPFPYWQINCIYPKAAYAFTSSVATNAAKHLLVFVHGFLSCAADMQLLADAVIRQHLPRCHQFAVLLARSNEENDHASIADMGAKLAAEVDAFVKKFLTSTGVSQISFVGHSLGSVVVRACVANSVFQPYVSKLHSLISLGGPHLGVRHNQNVFVDAGFRIMAWWNKSASLRSLGLDDESFLRELSENQSFSKFRHVVLFSSPHDGYVPYYSSRIEVSPAVLGDLRHGNALVRMAHNIFENLSSSSSVCELLMRVHIEFDHASNDREVNPLLGSVLHSRLNRILRRASHISYLCDTKFVEQFALFMGLLCGIWYDSSWSDVFTPHYVSTLTDGDDGQLHLSGTTTDDEHGDISVDEVGVSVDDEQSS